MSLEALTPRFSLFSPWEPIHGYNMASNKYRLIQEEDAIDGRSMHHHDECLGFMTRGQFARAIVFITLAVSLATNAVFIMRHFLREPCEHSSRTAFSRFPLERCVTQLTERYQLALSAINKLHGMTTANLLATIEPYGIRLGSL